MQKRVLSVSSWEPARKEWVQLRLTHPYKDPDLCVEGGENQTLKSVAALRWWCLLPQMQQNFFL